MSQSAAKPVVEEVKEDGFNFDEYFKSSDMFNGIPPVYKRIQNILNHDENLSDTDIGRYSKFNIDQMLDTVELVETRRADLDGLETALQDLENEENEAERIGREIFVNNPDENELKLSDYNLGLNKELRKFVAKKIQENKNNTNSQN